jgi:outer membrane protein assembly factor BamB
METDEHGFIARLSKQALPLRILAFSLFVVLAIGLIFAATGLLYYFNVRNYPRIKPVALTESVITQEFVSLPDADSYPAALAVAGDGTLYTGSYVSGVLWQIAPDGSMSEIPNSRGQIGSVISLEYADGLYVLDNLEALSSGGAKLWRINETGVNLLQDLPDMLQANDITVDAEGRVYIADLAGKIYRLDSTGLNIWWQVPSADYAPAGLAYENETIFVSDALRGEIYAIPTNASDTEAERTVLFTSTEAVGFNGMSIGANGKLFVADLLNNQVWESRHEWQRESACGFLSWLKQCGL